MWTIGRSLDTRFLAVTLKTKKEVPLFFPLQLCDLGSV